MKDRDPLSVGTAVTHVSQQWAPRIPGGTAVILEVEGPCRDGSYEYQVRAARDFSRRPGVENPMDRVTWWSSLAVRVAKGGSDGSA